MNALCKLTLFFHFLTFVKEFLAQMLILIIHDAKTICGRFFVILLPFDGNSMCMANNSKFEAEGSHQKNDFL